MCLIKSCVCRVSKGYFYFINGSVFGRWMKYCNKFSLFSLFMSKSPVSIYLLYEGLQYHKNNFFAAFRRICCVYLVWVFIIIMVDVIRIFVCWFFFFINYKSIIFTVLPCRNIISITFRRNRVIGVYIIKKFCIVVLNSCTCNLMTSRTNVVSRICTNYTAF